MSHYQDISTKANKVLNIILLAFVLILMRVWYLAVIQKEYHQLQARRPQRRSVIEHADRATIRDRFNIPLSMNKIQYNAAVSYAQIRQIPATIWKKDQNGVSKKVQARAEHIANLSKVLAAELNLSASELEDIIQCKASLFPQVPFVIQSDITEKQYFRLRMLEKNFPGLHMERSAKRFYPLEKVGAHVVGYMGSISQQEYNRIAEETYELEEYIRLRDEGDTPILPKGFVTPMEVRKRFFELQEKAYTINDFVGKAGIEATFDECLRGYYGKKNLEVDVKGNFVRVMPGSRKMVPGQRVLLSISSELQATAEALLAQYETPSNKYRPDAIPWIKGGAIVAMIPQTGEIVALASSPRFNPNDFIGGAGKKGSERLKWLETEAYIGEIWDGKRPLYKEYYSPTKNSFEEVSLDLSWRTYLDFVLSQSSTVKSYVENWGHIEEVVHLQRTIKQLSIFGGMAHVASVIDALFDGDGHVLSARNTPEEKKREIRNLWQKSGEAESLQREVVKILGPIKHNNDKLLALDLSRIVLREEDFSLELLKTVKKQSIDEYREFSQICSSLQKLIEKNIREEFKKTDFQNWRDSSFKDYLKQKRREEKIAKKHSKPYLDYLEEREKFFFKEFWQAHSKDFLDAFYAKAQLQGPLVGYQRVVDGLRQSCFNNNASLQKCVQFISQVPAKERFSYLQTLRGFANLQEPLYGKYRFARYRKEGQIGKDLAAAFYPRNGYGYSKSHGFSQSTPLGSVFKLMTSYQALVERYEHLTENNISVNDLNPLTLIDDIKGGFSVRSSRQILGYTLEGQPIHRFYKGGLLPRGYANVGKIDLVGALEKSSNMYFSILAGEHLQDPNSLVEASRLFGFGELSGIDLPAEYTGVLPDDVGYNRTGLYAFAIGQHSLVVTPLQCSLMISSLANGGTLYKPKIVQVIAGKEPLREEASLYYWQKVPFQEALSLVGIDFPFFTEAQEKIERTSLDYHIAEVRRTIFLPKEMRSLLLEGMFMTVNGARGTARASAIVPSKYDYPVSLNDLKSLQNQLIGKTGTAEIKYKHTLDEQSPATIMNNVWFAATSFNISDKRELADAEPELVVVVYLQFGKSGKEGAPIAAQIVKKWREIRSKQTQPPAPFQIPRY